MLGGKSAGKRVRIFQIVETRAKTLRVSVTIPTHRLTTVFEENFRARGEVGAACCVWQDGREIASLAGGTRDRNGGGDFAEDTLVLVWSATKAPAAACVNHALQEARLSIHDCVRHIWPEFGAAGKEEVTFAHALSHSAGLCALEQSVPILDHEACAAALAAQRPAWEPGTGHGYHPRTFGPLLAEILRRLVPGRTLGQYWREVFAEPLGLDFWIGLPDALHARVAPSLAARVAASAQPDPDPLYAALAEAGSLTRRSFASPAGLHAVTQMNSPEARRAELPANGGIGTARALAKFYSFLALGGVPLFRLPAHDGMMHALTSGLDRVLRSQTAFSPGFMLDPLDAVSRKTRHLFGPSRFAFGHPGAGGVHAFCDPEHKIGFAYVMNQMELGVFPRQRALALVDAVYEEVGQ